MAWKTWDPKLGKYVEGYTGSWSSLNPTGSTNTTKTSGYTNYSNLTSKTPTKNTSGWTASNLSYVKDAWYWWSWNKWDKSANIDNDLNRQEEVKYNVWQDQVVNPKLFKNRNDYNKYYKYDEASPSQQKLYDELWANANKYWLDSYQNKTADDASQVIKDQNDKNRAFYSDYEAKSKAAANLVQQKLDDRLKPLFNEIQAMQAQWLNDFDELRQMQKQYYANVKKEYDAAKAWESASLVSQLSWQWVASGIIGNAVAGQDKVWGTRYNELMKNHIATLRDLTDKTATFMNNIWNTKTNLTEIEKQWLDDWAKSMDDVDKYLLENYVKMNEDEYSPYKAATQSKVEGMNEWLQTQWKRDAKTANYKETDADNWATQITNDIGAQLQITDASKMAKLMTLAKDAWTKFDWNPVDAKNYIYSKLWLDSSSSSKWNNNYASLESILKSWKLYSKDELTKINPNISYEDYLDAYYN